MQIFITFEPHLLTDSTELTLSKPISLACDYSTYNHIEKITGTAIIKEINKNNLQRQVDEELVQKIIKDYASLLAAFFSDYVRRFYNE